MNRIFNQLKQMLNNHQLFSFVAIVLLALGVMGAGFSKNAEGSNLVGSFAELVGFKQSNTIPNSPYATPFLPDPSQPSKEYIYAGSRMLAIEDYGTAPSGTPTPTPQQQMWAGTNQFLQVNADNSLTVTDGYNYRIMESNVKLNGTGDWVQQVYTANTSQGALHPTYGQSFEVYQGSKRWVVATYNCLWESVNWAAVTPNVCHTNGDVMKFQRGNNGDLQYYKNGVLAHTFNGNLASDPNQQISVRFMTYYGNWNNGAVFPPLSYGSGGTPTPTPTPPQPPLTPTITSVTTNPDPTCLDIGITPVAGALSYNVRHVASQYTVNVLQANFPWCGLQASTYNEYQAQAVNNVGASAWSATVGGTTAAPAPQPPTTPTIASVTPNTDPTCLNIAINSVAGALSYNVRILNSGYTVNVLQTSFPWCGLTANTYFEYQAQAVNNVGASSWSATVGGTTSAPAPQPPTTPTIASVTPNTDPTCLNIAINPVTGALSYNVRAVVNGYTINVLQPSFPWCGLTANTYYGFQAQAVNNIGASAWSATVGGTTAAPPAPLSATVAASPGTIFRGDEVTINWTTNQPRPNTDYLALYRGITLVSTHSITGGVAGSTILTPTLAATYRVKYFVQGNSTPIATSNTFTVTNPR
jgi:hypothetical protein